jgi:hypothetical protein
MNEIQTPLVRENPASKYSCLYIVITICRDTRDYLVHSAQARNAQAVTCHTMLQTRSVVVGSITWDIRLGAHSRRDLPVVTGLLVRIHKLCTSDHSLELR